MDTIAATIFQIVQMLHNKVVTYVDENEMTGALGYSSAL